MRHCVPCGIPTSISPSPTIGAGPSSILSRVRPRIRAGWSISAAARAISPPRSPTLARRRDRGVGQLAGDGRVRQGAGVDAQVGDVRPGSRSPTPTWWSAMPTLQWVPEHAELLVRWAAALSTGSWIAVQMPATSTHRRTRRCERFRRRAVREQVARHAVPEARGGQYQPAGTRRCSPTRGAGCDAWEDRLVQGVDGEHPVLESIRALRCGR